MGKKTFCWRLRRFIRPWKSFFNLNNKTHGACARAGQARAVDLSQKAPTTSRPVSTLP